MPLPLIPIAIISLAGLAFKAKVKRDASFAGQNYQVVTPERQVIYDTAMNKVTDPNKLIAIAGEFDKQGLTAHGDMLRKRAQLRGLPADIKAQRKAVYEKALQSKNKAAVIQVAQAFHGEGCSGSATELFKYASSL